MQHTNELRGRGKQLVIVWHTVMLYKEPVGSIMESKTNGLFTFTFKCDLNKVCALRAQSLSAIMSALNATVVEYD